MVVTNAYTYTKVIEIPDSIIASAITNGTVCRVRGEHEWIQEQSVYVGLYEVKPYRRTCKICGRKQGRVEKWEDEQ
jgi:hypothetical protein